MPKALDYDEPGPEVGEVLTWSGRDYVVNTKDVGQHFGHVYTRLTLAATCAECGGSFAQTSALRKPWLAQRCKACDPKGAKDAADRKAYVHIRKASGVQTSVTVLPLSGETRHHTNAGAALRFVFDDGRAVDVPAGWIEMSEAPAAPPWRLDNARLAYGCVIADLHDGLAPDPVEVSWRPGSRGFDTHGLNEALAAEFQRLTAASAGLL